MFRAAGRSTNWLGLTTLAIVLLLWEGLAAVGLLRFEFFPPPSAILRGLLNVIATGELAAQSYHTLTSMLAGWAIAMALGISFGLLLGASPWLRSYSMASVEILRPIPGIAFLPVALLLFGFSTTMELFVIVLPVLWPILIGTISGVMAVPNRLQDVGATLRLTRFEVVHKILLPAAAPVIFVGARIGLTLSLVLAIIAEMVGNPQGLGYAIVSAQQALRPDEMFAYIMIVGVLGIAINILATVASRRVAALAIRRSA
jgi:ABC-type nitrate/sulfonate/bicarbonate transport system permease component